MSRPAASLFSPIALGPITQPSVGMLSLTSPAAATPRWALLPALISPPAAITSLSETAESPGESGVIRIGTTGTQTATYVAGVWQAPITGDASPVRVNSSGKLGTVPSSKRFKEEIKPMDESSEAIHSLRPVTFRYKEELDPEGIPQFGLVAEEVARVNPDLVVTDEQGQPFSVRYEEINAMLLNEFLKEHREVQEQTCINQQQEATIARLEAGLKEQADQIQKVSAQLAAVQTGARLATNE